jgi:rubrerythrin
MVPKEVTMRFKSVDEILDFAIEKEEESAQFYTDLASKAEHWTMGKVFEDFAREEVKHKEKLLAVKGGKLLAPAVEKVKDLKIADYLVDVSPTPELDYQQALILAMKKEKASFRLYSDLAATTDDNSLKATLLSLAQEEARHKLRLEVEYDEHFLSEN